MWDHGCGRHATNTTHHLQKQIQREGQLFDFRRPDTPPILLIMDRRNDPVTPLLTQWTYQAMVHELIGIHHGRVDMSNVPDVRNELKVLSLFMVSKSQVCLHKSVLGNCLVA